MPGVPDPSAFVLNIALIICDRQRRGAVRFEFPELVIVNFHSYLHQSAAGAHLIASVVDDELVSSFHFTKILYSRGICDAVPNGLLVTLEIGERICAGFGLEKKEHR